jgi:hypothetical protein
VWLNSLTHKKALHTFGDPDVIFTPNQMMWSQKVAFTNHVGVTKCVEGLFQFRRPSNGFSAFGVGAGKNVVKWDLMDNGWGSNRL